MAEIVNFFSTSSGPNGWSRLSRYLECPALASVKQKEEAAAGDVKYQPFPEIDGKPVAATVGSLYGHLVAEYRAGRPVAPSAKFTWNDIDIEGTHPATCAQARTLAEHYAKKYGPDTLGEIIGVEVPIEIPESVFGLRITGAIDTVACRGGLHYIVDDKTDSREDKNLKMKYSTRCQTWIYALGYELATGIKPAGCIIENAIKTQTPKFFRWEYEGLTDRRFKWLAASVERVKQRMQNPQPEPSIGNCWQYGRACDFYLDDVCSLML